MDTSNQEVKPKWELTREINFYNKCITSSGSFDLTEAIHAYAMINTSSTVAVTYDWVNQLLHKDGKNRKIIDDQYGSVSTAVTSTDDTDNVDDYYRTALMVAMNQFLNEQKTSAYYDMYALTISIFLISEGLRGSLNEIELPESVRRKTDDVIMELDEKIDQLVHELCSQCQKVQPELYEKFRDLGVNLINEPTNTVVIRWFTTNEGTVLINDDLRTIVQGFRADYLRYIKKSGKVELATLLKMYGMVASTYNRYKRDVISKVITKCDASLMSYVKYLLLNKD